MSLLRRNRGLTRGPKARCYSKGVPIGSDRESNILLLLPIAVSNLRAGRRKIRRPSQNTEDLTEVNRLDGIRYALQTRVSAFGDASPSSPIGRFIRNEPVTISELIADVEKTEGYSDLATPLRKALLRPFQ